MSDSEDKVDYIELAESWLDEREVHYVAKQGMYMIHTTEGSERWIPVGRTAIEPFCPIWSKNFAKAVRAVQSDRGWLHLDNTYSFRNTGTDFMNLMSRDGWIQPCEGDHHWLFDVLMCSLGGGKEENIKHIEHVIFYKWLSPECYTLPTILLHGEGGTGKNILFELLLHTMFDKQTASPMAQFVIGNFNGLVTGKTAVLIDEAMSDRIDASALKALLHKKNFYANNKYGKQYECDNTAWYCIGCNDEDAGVYLDRSNADRRYSVCHVPKGRGLTLVDWIAKKLNTNTQAAEKWKETNLANILTDREHVGKWLNHLIDKYGDCGQPQALHGEDFQRLMAVQKDFTERFIEAVFTDENFKYIRKETLYLGYASAARRNNYKPLGSNKFKSKVESWIITNQTDVIDQQLEMTVPSTTSRFPSHYTKANIRRRDNKCNDHIYLTVDGSTIRWIGPEIN